MAKSENAEAAAEPVDAGRSFEDALQELQQIVSELEEGEIGLEESLERFERGIALLRSCYRILERAEQRIEILVGFNAEGEPVTEPFQASATVEQSGGRAGRRPRRTKRNSADTTDTSDE
ncbi:MAG TPA: exodeoxyribonuclease VII small subunit [Planctomycetaceae bacterium]|nr:exodeoxyribonuclease VII small subunit [Planctomycetaceae bacterium]